MLWGMLGIITLYINVCLKSFGKIEDLLILKPGSSSVQSLNALVKT